MLVESLIRKAVPHSRAQEPGSMEPRLKDWPGQAGQGSGALRLENETGEQRVRLAFRSSEGQSPSLPSQKGRMSSHQRGPCGKSRGRELTSRCDVWIKVCSTTPRAQSVLYKFSFQPFQEWLKDSVHNRLKPLLLGIRLRGYIHTGIEMDMHCLAQRLENISDQ